MDISGISSPAVSQASSQKTGDAISIAVLNKALDVEAKTAVDLINSVAKPAQEIPKEKMAPHLGGNVDVRA
jgi:Putative motility protein